uniref:Major facilitator superfamily (MFS) profile domain-containing protein n=1 Tax=Acrobeloides nanus TaxID=290746 RepID=A0A914EHZ1_9BILA
FEPIYDEEIKKNGKVDHNRSLELQRQEPIAEEDEDKVSPHLTEDKKEPRMIKKMLDLSLVADPVFLLFAFSNFLTTIGLISLPTFMPINAEMVLGLSQSNAAITVIVYGIASFFGLIVFSSVGDNALPFKYGKDRARNRLWIYSWFLMISGVASVFVFFMVDQWVFTSYCFIFGFFITPYRFTSVILVDFIGIERFTSAFGLLLLVQGIADFVGPIICNKIYDITWSYDLIFTFCGICLFLSGIMLFTIPFIKKRRNEVGFKNSAEKHCERPLLH